MIGDQRSTAFGMTNSAPVDLPRSAEIVWAFSAGPTDSRTTWHPVLDAAADLAARHDEQWSAEDASRDGGDDDRAVARAKRRIDALNRARMELVDRVDAWAEVAVIGEAAASSLHTETLGLVVDRLAVAWVRSRRVAGLAGPGPDGRDDARRALTLLVQLCDAYDDLVRDLRDGGRRLPVWRTLKRYGSRG